MCTDRDVPGARSPKPQCRAPAVTSQPATAGLTVHTIPVPAGSGSVTSTVLAVPPLLLLSVMVNPMASPALTAGASAVFVITRFGHKTVVLALACTEALLSSDAVAVFG